LNSCLIIPSFTSIASFCFAFLSIGMRITLLEKSR
jgi:hypothetical protein